jgi:hypothetical protein
VKATIAEERRVLQPEVERRDEELREAVEELRTAVRRRIDPKLLIADYPLWALGGAFFVGLWLGFSRKR